MGVFPFIYSNLIETEEHIVIFDSSSKLMKPHENAKLEGNKGIGAYKLFKFSLIIGVNFY